MSRRYKTFATPLTSNPSRAGSDGCSAHAVPKIGKKPFAIRDEWSGLVSDGLITLPEELKGATTTSWKPPWKGKQVEGRLVLPHFG